MNFENFSILIQKKWRLLSIPLSICLMRYSHIYREDAEWILDFLTKLTIHFGDEIKTVIAEYYNYILEQIQAQEDYNRSASYQYCKEEQIKDIVNDRGFQKSNLYILTLSYLLSLHRYELLLYIRSFAENYVSAESRCLQIGTGIGIETTFIDKQGARIDSYDINPYSALCLKLLEVSSHVRFLPNIYDFKEVGKYNHCLLVELLEHVENPGYYLQGVNNALKRKGNALLTFALRMPQVDHIYNFSSVSECRRLVNNNGFDIIDEEYFISSFKEYDHPQKKELAESSKYGAVYACVARKS